MASLMGGLEAEAYDRNYGDRALLGRIASYFRPHLGKVALVALMVVLISLGATITPIIIARGIETLTGDPQTQLLLGLAGLVTTLGVLGWGFNFVRQTFAARAVGDVVLALRRDALAAVLRRDMSFFDQNASGRIVSRVANDTQDFATVVTLTVDLISQLVLVLVIGTVMLVLNTRLALITLAIGPVVLLVALGFRVLARRVMRQSQRATAEVNTIVQETISGAAVAKSFRQEASLYADFAATNALAYRIQIQRVAVFGSIFPLLNTLAGIGVALVVYVGGLFVLDGSVSVSEWYLFVQGLTIFFYPISSIASFWSQFQQGLAASERVFALVDAEPTVVQVGDDDPGRLRGEIRFERVWFSYDGEARAWGLGAGQTGEAIDSQPTNHLPSSLAPSPQPLAPSAWVLHDFSLAVASGESLAIVGHTGAGKSSLMKLILRFYEFQQGQLLVDGRDIRSLDLEAYRRQIGLVPQSPFLFSGTVADNIRYGRPDASDAEVAAAARSLGDGSWIDDLPQGLQTDVGERGARLSLGQRQLVALARVLFQNPAVVLLDEATASIDPLTEAQIQAGLSTTLEGRTSIIIAHRLSTVIHADRIIVLRQGQIIEQGTHEELLARGGHYAELYATYFRHQASDYQPDEEVEDSGFRVQVPQ
ncbi:MAG: ABC transporter ATP-binding protein [Roseiflexaceae bacterium]|nr:ABC transporter ATP-binding protein [Roseiflexaceae bacterium]